MCGIVGYVGNQQAAPLLLGGLRRLEYRGYDSAGIAIEGEKGMLLAKNVGKIENLIKKCEGKTLAGQVGIAHTRWATHGGVTEENAHPHTSCRGEIVLAHNGIIENYRELKKKLGKKHTYTSETDSEVLAHLIEHYYEGDLRKAVMRALSEVRGTYGIVVMHVKEKGKIVAARLGSPLVIGMGEHEHYIASDPTPMIAFTKQVTFLDDGEIAEITGEKVQIFNLKDKIIKKSVEKIDWNDEQAQKQGYDHFMIKEIFEEPIVFEDAIRGRIDMKEGTARLGGINLSEEEMRSIKRVYFIACGTAYHAAMIGKYAFERLVGIPCDVDVASEFRYRDPVLDKHTLVFVISQSGETADTLAALKEAKRKGAKVRGIINVIGSTIAREAEGGTYIHAGPELSVASTKAYTNMVAVVLLYAIQFGRLHRVTVATGKRLLENLLKIPRLMEEVLEQNKKIQAIAKKYMYAENMFFLGRGVNYPVALEGSLKLKEIAYIHSEAYPGGEMKHGPIALLDKDFPVLAIATKNQLYEKMVSNIQEAKARRAKTIAIATVGDKDLAELADDIIYVPKTMELLEPLVNTLPLHLLAYHGAVALKRDVDRPRNLAKSVTVE